MWKKVLLMVGALAVSAGIGFVLPYTMADQSVGVTVDEAALQEQFKMELTGVYENQVERIYEQEFDAFVAENPDALKNFMDVKNGLEVEGNEGREKESEEDEVALVVVSADGEKESTSEEDSGSTSTVVVAEKVTEADLVEDTSDDEIDLFELESLPAGSEEAPVTEQIVKDAWVNQKIAENRDNIDEADLEAGSSIYNVLDTDYLFSKAEDGLTEAETQEVKDYLKQTLTEDEIATVMRLYQRYVGMLE